MEFGVYVRFDIAPANRREWFIASFDRKIQDKHEKGSKRVHESDARIVFGVRTVRLQSSVSADECKCFFVFCMRSVSETNTHRVESVHTDERRLCVQLWFVVSQTRHNKSLSCVRFFSPERNSFFFFPTGTIEAECLDKFYLHKMNVNFCHSSIGSESFFCCCSPRWFPFGLRTICLHHRLCVCLCGSISLA